MIDSDAEFLRAFQACTLESLSHIDHVRLAWIVLQDEPLDSAIHVLSNGFQAFATSKGKPELFHVTITWAFMSLINERIRRGLGGERWQQFVDLNPDLCRGLVALKEIYQDSTLNSELARETFVLPDRFRSS